MSQLTSAPVVFTLALLAAASARADDAWIEPAEFAPAAPGEVAVHLRVGRDHEVRDFERRPGRILRFVIAGPDEAPREVGGETGATPAGVARLERAGLHAIGYVGRPNWVELSREAFALLLRERGHEALLAEAAERPRTQILYARCARTLLVAGEGGPVAEDRPLGLPLELLAEPPHLPDAPLRVRLLREGAPLAGLRVRAVSLDRHAGTWQTTTDAEGRATFTLPHGGRWLLSAVVVERGADLARWEMTWASLTLRLPGTPPPGRAASGAFAHVLARARASGAAARVLGVHRFLMERRFFDRAGAPREARRQRNLMSYTLTLDEAGEALTVDVEVVPEGGEPFHLIYTVDARDGRVRSMAAGARAERDGEVLVIDAGSRESRAEGPTLDQLLPKMVGVFALPMLADQGLPDALSFRDLSPGGDVTRPYLLRPLDPADEPDPARYTWVTEEGRAAPTTYARVDRASKLLLELHTVSGIHRLTSGEEIPAAVWHSERLTEERFAELRAGW